MAAINVQSDCPVLVLEVGGTTLRGGRFEPATGGITGRISRPTIPSGTPAEASADELLTELAELSWQILGSETPRRVSIAFAGPMDSDGRLLAAPTVLGSHVPSPFWLRDGCRRIWPEAEVWLLNDLTAAGARHVGSGRSDFCIITAGSGIGHKVFMDGRPLVGPAGRGGEIGHLRVEWTADALACECGGTGHLGAIASGRGVSRYLERQARRDPVGFSESTMAHRNVFDTEEICRAFKAGDPWVREHVAAAVGHLGRAVAAMHLAVGVEDIILMGGFAQGLGEHFRQLVVSAASAATWDTGQDWDAMVQMTTPDDDAGMIGAGLVAAGIVDLGPK